ncbi:hypothetical protein BKP45_06220 [Anaerobacillus alkalidiazotrophicus]|uniref:Lipoprotein n=1 Tax=Anaerobacillus alkalidiazotrophicus TaxID=472963 RepID=A0A1S2MCB5_9BACI|nr:DUF6612 family protein [Anaerobacillus alkalidiazotrophicus]OIJ22236.1 hypothetical protein BKP45_06220 [Anaerobacillus alkalidiazotrophicus]
MLRKLKSVGIAIVFMLVMSACNSESSGSLTSASDVLIKSLELMEGLNSYSMKMESNQTLTINDDETVEMFLTLNADMTLAPLAFYQKMMMETDMEMMSTIETEMYFVDNQIYMYEPMTNEWMQLPPELIGEIGALSELQISPEQQLNVLTSFIDEIDMTESGNEYVLKLTGEGTEFLEIAKLFGGVGTEDFEEMLELFSHLELNNIDYEIFIDKETLYQTRLNMIMEMEMVVDGERVHTVQTMSATIYGYNEVDEIVLPEEVIK